MRVRRIATALNTVPTRPASSETKLRLESLNEADAARYIGMSAAWLKKSRTKRTKGQRDRPHAPPFVRVGTRRVVYRLVDLDAWQLAHLEGVAPTRTRLGQSPRDEPGLPADQNTTSHGQFDAPASATVASRENSDAPAAAVEPAFERHYRIEELAEIWNVARATVRVLVKEEDGVLKVSLPPTKARTIYSVPESVARRIHTRLQNGR